MIRLYKRLVNVTLRSCYYYNNFSKTIANSYSFLALNYFSDSTFYLPALLVFFRLKNITLTLNAHVHNGEKKEEPVKKNVCVSSRTFLIMEGALVSETVPCPSRFESPCSCSIVSVRSSRVRLNLWFLWCVHVRARTRGTAMARRACEWVEDSPWKGVSIERESCACRCWPALRYKRVRQMRTPRPLDAKRTRRIFTDAKPLEHVIVMNGDWKCD